RGVEASVAQRAPEPVDVADGLACDLLDGLDRGAGARRVPVLEQPCGAGLDEDHVERVAGRVVKVAGDPRPLLGGGGARLALGVALGARRALLELASPLATVADPIAGNPRAAPDEQADEQR